MNKIYQKIIPAGKTPAKRQLDGFTLIELLVVVLIIGILSAVALPQYQKAVIKSRFASVKAAGTALADAQSLYFMANGEYSKTLDALDIQMPAGGKYDESKRTISYPWGECYLACDANSSCGGCGLKENGAIRLIYFYPNFLSRKPSCVAYDASPDVYREICKAETGRAEPSIKLSTYGIYYY